MNSPARFNAPSESTQTDGRPQTALRKVDSGDESVLLKNEVDFSQHISYIEVNDTHMVPGQGPEASAIGDLLTTGQGPDALELVIPGQGPEVSVVDSSMDPGQGPDVHDLVIPGQGLEVSVVSSCMCPGQGPERSVVGSLTCSDQGPDVLVDASGTSLGQGPEVLVAGNSMCLGQGPAVSVVDSGISLGLGPEVLVAGNRMCPGQGPEVSVVDSSMDPGQGPDVRDLVISGQGLERSVVGSLMCSSQGPEVLVAGSSMRLGQGPEVSVVGSCMCPGQGPEVSVVDSRMDPGQGPDARDLEILGQGPEVSVVSSCMCPGQGPERSVVGSLMCSGQGPEVLVAGSSMCPGQGPEVSVVDSGMSPGQGPELWVSNSNTSPRREPEVSGISDLVMTGQGPEVSAISNIVVLGKGHEVPDISTPGHGSGLSSSAGLLVPGQGPEEPVINDVEIPSQEPEVVADVCVEFHDVCEASRSGGMDGQGKEPDSGSSGELSVDGEVQSHETLAPLDGRIEVFVAVDLSHDPVPAGANPALQLILDMWAQESEGQARMECDSDTCACGYDEEPYNRGSQEEACSEDDTEPAAVGDCHHTLQPMSDDWKEEKNRFLSMTLDEKRKYYDCGDNYVMMGDLPTWRNYAEMNNLHGSKVISWSQCNTPFTDKGFSDIVSLWMGDITTLEIDVLVNAANFTLLGGGGVDGAIHMAAGPALLNECAALNGCDGGQAKCTGGYKLPAKYVVHTVGPRSGEEDLLKQCYWNSLTLMQDLGQRTIVFPCISTGMYGFPKKRAAELAVGTTCRFLEANLDAVDRIVFCVFLPEDLDIYKQILSKYLQIDRTDTSAVWQSIQSANGLNFTEKDQDGNVLEPAITIPRDFDIVTRRGMPELAGIYIEGTIQGEEIVFTVDSGATSTILAYKSFMRIPITRRPKLEYHPKVWSPATADGRSMKHFGCAVFQIELGSLLMDKRMTVAEIQDEVLLGADVIQWDSSGPADILLTQNIMILRQVAIPLHQVGYPERTRKVRCADHHVVPPMSEMLIDVLIDRQKPDQGDEHLLVEANTDLATKYSLVVAPSLVDISRRCTVRVRVLNPTMKSISLKQDMTIGVAESISEPPLTLLEEEEEGEGANLSAIRRIGKGSTEIALTRRIDENVPDSDNLDVPKHLQETMKEASKACSSNDQCAQLAHLLRYYGHAFSVDDHDLGLTHITEHVIETGGARPIKQPPRRVPMAFAGEDKEAINKLWKQGSIRPSTSPWASPIVLVRKKDGQVRTCVDYRRLNSVTVKDAFPIPRVQDCLDAVAGSVLFSTMDITAAYNQIPVRPGDIPKTAFCSRYGLMEFVTMPFGLATATATFQRTMEIALAGLQWTSCLIYLDDVVVFGNNFEEHLRRLDLVLERIARAGLKLKPKKCHLFQEEVTFLGHVVSKRGVLPNPDNVVKMVNWPVPSTPTHVRSFLGMAQYYRRFVKNFSDVARPLTDLTKKGMKFKWTEACQTAFSTLKDTLLSPEVMAYPQNDGLFILDTDASLVAIGAVLSQVQEEVERVVAYGSKTLGKAERNYCTTDRELLAVKYFMEYYKHYLLGKRFLVRTDHQPLRYLHSLKEPKDRTARWIESMSTFDFGIEYRPGKKHGNADAMSRCPSPLDCQCPDVLDLENLKCGPCRKCRRRAEVMLSDMQPSKVDLEANSEDTESSPLNRMRCMRASVPVTHFKPSVDIKRAQMADSEIRKYDSVEA